MLVVFVLQRSLNVLIAALDVESIYPDIDHEERAITCELYLIQRSNWHIKTKIPKDVILLVLRKNTMMFCDRYFLQTKATAIEPCAMNLVLILSFWMSIARHSQSTQNNKFAYLCNISRKTWGMKLIFCLHITRNFSIRW